MNNTRILLAVGNENVSGILRKYINKAELLHLIDQEIMHFRYLDEIIELHEPEILIVHDVFLPSDTTGKSEREKEWLSFLHLRVKNMKNFGLYSFVNVQEMIYF